MSNHSAHVANRLRTAEVMQSSVDAHLTEVARDFATRVGGVSETEVAKLVVAVAAYLRRLSDELGAREAHYSNEQADDAPARDERDGAVGEVALSVAEARELVRAGFGDEGVRRYGLDGTLTGVPDRLVKSTQTIIGRLRDDPQTATTRMGAVVDTADLAQRLEPLVERLATCIGVVDREARELHSASARRNAAIDAWASAYPGIGAVLEGIYHLAGQHHLAERIRPSARRATGKDAAAEPAEPTAAEPAAAEPAVSEA